MASANAITSGSVVITRHSMQPCQLSHSTQPNRRCFGAADACRPTQPLAQSAVRQSSVRRNTGLRAGGGDSEASPVSQMSPEEASSLLEVSQDASFDAVLQAKKRLTADLPENSQKVREIEAAYDVLLMASMKRRLSGDVSTSVRYADVTKFRPASQAQQNAPRSLFGVVNVQRPSNSALATPSILFATLAGWSLLQGLTEAPGLESNVPALQLGLSGMASFYFLKQERKVATGRAIGLAIGGAFLGALIGGALNSWLRVDVVPIGGLSSPVVFVSEFAILSSWATSVFLF